MALRNSRTEAVGSYFELARRVETTPNTVSALAADATEASALAGRLEALPPVGSVTTIDSLVPKDQQPKLAAIAEARELLDFSINPFAISEAPTDAEVVAALRSTADRLLGFHSSDAALRAQAAALSSELKRLSTADRIQRGHALDLLLRGLPTALSQISASLTAGPVTAASLPDPLRHNWLASDGTARIEVAPSKPLLDAASTAEFVAAVRNVIPTAAGDAVTVVESKDTVLRAFRWAGILSATVIAAMLLLVLRSLYGVVLALAPVLLAGVLTFGTCAMSGIAINLENLIALPLLAGIGVAFNIYCVAIWSSGATIRVASSLGRGIAFSALTTGTSFATLMFSSHPGTSSMGALLLIALGWIVIISLLVSPSLAASLPARAT
jgi:predicted RND superfamily exporter protein